MTALIVLLVVLALILLSVLWIPEIRALAEARQLRRIEEHQRLVDARLKFMTYTALQQMHEVARHHQEADGQ